MPDDAWRAVSKLGAAQHGAFTRSQATLNGIDDRRLKTALRQGRIERAGPNLFVFLGGAPDPLRPLMLATLVGRGAVASHRGAAHLHACDGFETPRAEVSVLAGQRWRPPAPGMIGHWVRSLPKADVLTVNGIRTTGIARTLADLGAVVDREAVRRALIGQHARGHSLTWFRQTAAAVDAPGTNGARVLLGLLDEYARAGTMPASWLEEVLRQLLAHPALPPLTSQYVLRDARGGFVARFDHAFVDVRLAIEGHSRRFHFGPASQARDEDRDLRSAQQGWEIVYLGWYAQRDPAEVVEAIAEVVVQRTARAAA